jgi:hypothetical protein
MNHDSPESLHRSNESAMLWPTSLRHVSERLDDARVIRTAATASATATAVGVLNGDATGVARTCGVRTGTVIAPRLKFKSLFEFGDRELFQQTELG